MDDLPEVQVGDRLLAVEILVLVVLHEQLGSDTAALRRILDDLRSGSGPDAGLWDAAERLSGLARRIWPGEPKAG